MGIVLIAAQLQVLSGVRERSPKRREPCAASSVTEHAGSSWHGLAGYLAMRMSQCSVVAKALWHLFLEGPSQRIQRRKKIVGRILAEQ